MVSALITVAVIAWCRATGLRRLANVLVLTVPSTRYASKGGLAWAVHSGRFKPRVVVAIALDDQQRIVDTLFMKGLTVFARPQKIPAITGMHVGDYTARCDLPHLIHYHRMLYHWRLN